ncbi:MAG: response regulator transcription factor [Candidatus Scalindua sp.]|nr:response regulator transcription factor [Candidatus Scalindua sp.]
MKILIAEDDLTSCRRLEVTLTKWGYEVVSCSNGKQAWDRLQGADAPKLAILDWLMPEMEGIEVCSRLRKLNTENPAYVILLTTQNEKEDIVRGLEAGADDYITKPFESGELQARIHVGCRVLQLQEKLANRIKDLQDSLQHIKTLQGILPICSYCKKIRDDQNYWEEVEEYVVKHSDADFTHSVCPRCYDKHVKKELEQFNES